MGWQAFKPWKARPVMNQPPNLAPLTKTGPQHSGDDLLHQRTKQSSWRKGDTASTIAESLLTVLQHVQFVYHQYYCTALGYDKAWKVPSRDILKEAVESMARKA